MTNALTYYSQQPRRNIVSAVFLASIIVLGFIIFGSINSNNGRLFINQAYSQKAAPNTATSAATSRSSSISTINKVPYMGVDLNGLATSRSQAKTSLTTLPPNYYDDSFKTISQAGMNHVRIVFYWEAYEKDPTGFINELATVAQTADKYGLKVMYDNHEFHTSSWLDPTRGIGFPWTLFKNNAAVYPAASGGQTKDPTAKVWWTNWWNRTVKDASGTDGWTLQANYLKKIVSTVDGHPSTLGYEILSEPQVHSIDQWSKIGTYNTFMVNQLRTLTHKTIAYSMNIPIDLKSPIGVTAPNLAKMAPANKANVVFKVSMYGSPLTSTFQANKLKVFLQTRQITGIPLYFGEWNNVKRETTIDEEGQIVSKINPQLSDISQPEATQIVQTFKSIGAWGAAYWIWNFQPHIVSNYNLIVVIAHNAPLQTTKYFDIVKTAYSTVYGSLIKPTLSPPISPRLPSSSTSTRPATTATTPKL
jgi:Cellulase (glycosyl hydrolase family 5)